MNRSLFRKAFALIATAVVICALIFGLVYMTAPFVLILNSDNILAKEWDNPYINSGYEGWTRTELPGVGSLYFPDNWEFLRVERGYEIYRDGKLIAFGDLFVGEKTSYEYLYEYMAGYLGFVPSAMEYVMIQGNFSVESCSYNGYEFSDNIQKSELATLGITVSGAPDGADFILYFLSEKYETACLTPDIAEAIVHSYMTQETVYGEQE